MTEEKIVPLRCCGGSNIKQHLSRVGAALLAITQVEVQMQSGYLTVARWPQPVP